MLFLAFFALFAPFAASMDASAQVPIAVYYETLCPDSIKFVTSQLYPAYSSGLKARLNITLVPFGRAIKNSSASGVSFECRHGPVECYGDKVQACAIQHLNQDQAKLMSFVNCLMGSAIKDAVYPVDTCGESTGVNLHDIVACANGTEGTTLLEHLADETVSLQPAIKSVPTIIVNGTYSDENQNLAISNLRQLVCSQIQGDKPNDCRGAASSSAAASLSIALLFVVSRMF